MRTWTLALSVCAHALAIGAVIVAPIFATDDLPHPRRALTIEPITIIDPPPPAPIRPPSTPPASASSSAPITEPNELPPIDAPAPEPARYVEDVADSGGGIASVGLVPGNEPTAPPVPAPSPVPPVRVGSGIRTPTRISYTAPVYPPLAIASKTEGVVILEAVLDEDGVVRNVMVLRSIPLLDDAAIQAVSRWRFTPTLLNGTPVPVVMTVTVAFTLKK
jgi:protein TonB